MDFIRRKYLIYTIDNKVEYLKNEFFTKISNFTLNHVLALKYIISIYHRDVITKDVISNVNFFIFLHIVKCKYIYDIVINQYFDITTLYIKSLVKNYPAFEMVINKYKSIVQEIMFDKNFIEILKNNNNFDDIIGVNYDIGFNPLFINGEPIRNMDIIYSKLFKKSNFTKVKNIEVIKLMIWAFLCKKDTGIIFDDNDSQDIYTLFQKNDTIIHSDMTEKIKESIFTDSKKTSFYIWLNEKISDDNNIYLNVLATNMYEKVLSYIYSEIKQGRVNKNMLKLVYMFEEDEDIQSVLLQIIYDVPGDILSIIDSRDENWKKYFIGLYKEKFIDGNTFISSKTFNDDLFKVVAAINPEYFDREKLLSVFGSKPEKIKYFDTIDINNNYISNIIYETNEVNISVIESLQSCQIYNDETKYFIKEYNTFLYLTEEDPFVLYNGILVKLSSVPLNKKFSLFSNNILKYYVDSKLASIGLVLPDYKGDILVKILSHLKCIEDITYFVKYAICKNDSIMPSVIRTILSSFNIPIILMFQKFLRDNFYHVEMFLEKTKHITKNDKNYIINLIKNGRS
ncbi:core protein [Cotia virus SPAn232]|uniref:Protein E6 homolog n=2 Tax=Cotia virus TaxID=39444 RepID=H6TA30_9POXV|nr:core protein [Cotia virus SPAn232]ADT91070.1 core protein [Cotia virus SPAn232]AIT70668.1 core protein [Cotia virus]